MINDVLFHHLRLYVIYIKTKKTKYLLKKNDKKPSKCNNEEKNTLKGNKNIMVWVGGAVVKVLSKE